MSKYRKAAKVDENQPQIVATLRCVPGVMVEVGHDDIIVGYKGKTYWYEIKEPHTWLKNGGIKAGALKDSQIRLINDWTGHYKVVWSVDQILSDLGIEE